MALDKEEMVERLREREEERAYRVGLLTLLLLALFLFLLVLWKDFFKASPLEKELLFPPSVEEKPKPEEASPLTSSEKENVYVVKEGDTLYSLGKKFGVDWKNIARLNKISPPYTLHEGQKLTIPKE